MLSTQNLALRNRRVDEVPPEAGDFARIINGSLFSLNGGRSSESKFDLNGGHLYWITSVLKQFDRTPSAPIKFSERAKLHRSMTDNNICISYSTASKILILVSLILHQLLYQSAESFRSMIYKLATTYALKMTKER